MAVFSVNAGFDCGARFTKAVLLSGRRIVAHAVVPTGADENRAARTALDKALAAADLCMDRIAGTAVAGGAGISCADLVISGGEALAKGVRFFFPNAGTAMDVGAVEARAIRMDANGRVLDTAVNEKCAAASGAIVEAAAEWTAVPLESMGSVAIQGEGCPRLQAQCLVFAAFQLPTLLRSGVSRADISQTIHAAMAARIAALVRRIGRSGEVALVGGMALFPAFASYVKRELQLESLLVPREPLLAGAAGAALAASERPPAQRRPSVDQQPPIQARKAFAWPREIDPGGFPGKVPQRCHTDIDWRGARFITLGIDTGTVCIKAVLMADGRMRAGACLPTPAPDADSVQKTVRLALDIADDSAADRIDCCVATGGGVRIPFARRTITEPACHARGAHFFFGGSVRTVIDAGGQSIKAIQCDAQGRVNRFLIQDKCAAGTGSGLDFLAVLLGTDVNAFGGLSASAGDGQDEACKECCVAHVGSVLRRRLDQGASQRQVLISGCRITAQQIHALAAKLNPAPELAVTGGMAKNRLVVDRLHALLGFKPLNTPWDPQLAGAAGAALFAYALCRKGKAGKALLVGSRRWE